MHSAEIAHAAQIIREGGVVAFPTETVYGLGADAFNAEAVAKIFEIKERPAFDPLIVHIADQDALHDLWRDAPGPWAQALAERFWPGPLTMVMDKSERVPDIVTAGLSKVGVRMPRHPVALALIRAAERPLAAPSANKFGRISPTTAQHVRKQLPDLPCILDGGPTEVGIESTVIALHDDGFEILRPGAITAQDLEVLVPASSQRIGPQLVAPGLLQSHYSPLKPLYIEGESVPPATRKGAAYLSFSGAAPEGYAQVEYLSQRGDLREAAVRLFGALHRLEESDWTYLMVEAIPETGLGIAIMDRLRKAAYPYKHKHKR